mmetsp:Transcript_17810/g.25789  ORF Transcript_17810/g.25789 Transcript_17810/m.25789 type:complete len:138 (-) Transcript_17810:220-633(-)
MATADEPYNIALYSTDKRIEVEETYMKLKILKGRVSCRDLASATKVGRSFANRIIREVDGTGHAPKTKHAIFGPGARCLSYEDKLFLLNLRARHPKRSLCLYLFDLFFYRGVIVSALTIHEWWLRGWNCKGNLQDSY